MMRIAAVLVCLMMASCQPAVESAEPGSPWLYVWAGDADAKEGDTDFLAVVDARPGSDTYGSIVSTAPVGRVGTNPHHAEPVAPTGSALWASGFRSGLLFRFDLSNPEQPVFEGLQDNAPGLAYAHSFLRLDDGTLLVTFQHGDGSLPGDPGGIARFDAAGGLLEVGSAADASFSGEIIRPYAIEALPEQDRILTTGRTMNMSSEQAADIVQIWRLSDLALLHTLRVPRVEPARLPECVFGMGDQCEPGQYPGEAQPFEARRMPDGSVLFNTLTCGFYRVSGLDTVEPQISLVVNYPDMVGCSVPAVIGPYYILPVIFGETILVMDMSDPAHVRETSRLDTPGYQPHWAAADPLADRVVVTSAGPDAVHTVLMLDMDRSTGALTLDTWFGSPDFPRAGISFYRESWPHGAGGTAIPHAALFNTNQ